jgi:hypothetical protein
VSNLGHRDSLSNKGVEFDPYVRKKAFFLDEKIRSSRLTGCSGGPEKNNWKKGAEEEESHNVVKQLDSVELTK